MLDFDEVLWVTEDTGTYFIRQYVQYITIRYKRSENEGVQLDSTPQYSIYFETEE